MHRARHGIRALRENADLAVSANGHSWDMVFENYFNHVSPTGETLLDRVVRTGYLPRRSTYIVGENIALGALEFGTTRRTSSTGTSATAASASSPRSRFATPTASAA